MQNQIVKKINKVIEEIRIYVQNDGGDLKIDNYDEANKILTIKVLGACADCPMIDDTFEYGVKQLLLKKLPKLIKNVIFIT